MKREHLDFVAGQCPSATVAVIRAGIDHFNMINQALGAERADHVLSRQRSNLNRRQPPR